MLASWQVRRVQPDGTQACDLIETHQRRLRIGRDVPCYEQEVAVPDDHTLLRSLKVDEYPGCSLGGFASATKNPKVLFFTEPGPGRAAPASATVKLPPIASADEDVVHEVVRARLKRQGGAILAIWGDRSTNEESAWGRLSEHRVLEGNKLIHNPERSRDGCSLLGPGGLRSQM